MKKQVCSCGKKFTLGVNGAFSETHNREVCDQCAGVERDQNGWAWSMPERLEGKWISNDKAEWELWAWNNGESKPVTGARIRCVCGLEHEVFGDERIPCPCTSTVYYTFDQEKGYTPWVDLPDNYDKSKMTLERPELVGWLTDEIKVKA